MSKAAAIALLGLASATASAASAQEPIPFAHGQRDGSCFVEFEGAQTPAALVLSFDVARKQFSARIRVPRWAASRASALGKSVPVTLTLNNGFTAKATGEHVAGTADEALALLDPKEPSWALFRALDTANNVDVTVGAEKLGDFPMGRSSLAYETIIYCMDDVEKGRV